jgi:4-oxalocrotonate tautomerase
VPIIRVEMFKGRSREQKRTLARALTDSFITVMGGKPEGVTIVIEDVEKENWAVAGVIMADKYPD